MQQYIIVPWQYYKLLSYPLTLNYTFVIISHISHGHITINMVYKCKESEIQVWKSAQRPQFWNKQDFEMYV